MSQTDTAPPTATRRRLTPDLARGLMLALIAMAYAPMYLSHDDTGGYGARPGGGVTDQTVSFVAALFLENRAFPLFGILFGYGMVMMLTAQSARGVSVDESRRLLRRRAGWLLVFGLLHAALVFPGEILAAYGLGTLIIGWLLFRPDAVVRRAVVVLALVYTVTVGLFGLMMSVADDSEYTEALPGYTTGADWITRVISAPVAPLMNVLFFPMLILIAIGVWLGRRRLLEDVDQNAGLLRRLAIGGITGSVLGALPLALAGADIIHIGKTGYGALLSLQILTGVLGGVGYAAVFGLVGNRLEQRPGAVSRALSAAGQRSLSVYLFNSIMIAVILHPDLLGVGELVHRAAAMAIALGVWLCGVLLANLLAKAGRPGPADALLRRLVRR